METGCYLYSEVMTLENEKVCVFQLLLFVFNLPLRLRLGFKRMNYKRMNTKQAVRFTNLKWSFQYIYYVFVDQHAMIFGLFGDISK